MTTIVTYTIVAIDAVTGTELKVRFPAMSPLMARAWAELCFKNNPWSSIELHAPNSLMWSATK